MKNCTYWFRVCLVVFVLLVRFSFPAFSQQVPKGFAAANGEWIGFLEYKPADYNADASTKHPLIIFLHGIGERGNGTTELSKLNCCGIPRMITKGHNMRFYWNGKWETFLVISPQAAPKYGMWPNFYVNELIEYAKQNLRIDTNRIFVTGLSMGGGGTWRYTSNELSHSQKLAAIAPICAPCTMSNGSNIARANLPVWAYHAADDAVCTSWCTEKAIGEINAANPAVTPIKTIWPTGGHVVWDRVYHDTLYKWQNPSIYEWFLGQNKSLPVNKLPVAKAGADQNITNGTGIATLDAGASTDADGTIVRYVWKKLSGPTAGTISGTLEKSPVISGMTTGTYVYQLEVIDNRAGFTFDTVQIIVATGSQVSNLSPIAKAGNDITITLPTNSVNLSGAASSDPDGSISSYQWNRIAGPGSAAFSNATAVATSLSGLAQGVHYVQLQVTDNRGATAKDTLKITVNQAANILPVAKAGSDIVMTLPVNSATINGNASADPDGTISSYNWSMVNGPSQYTIANPNAANTTFGNLVEGVYYLRLRVTDNSGGADDDTVKVTVYPAPVNQLPIAQAGSDITITLPVQNATLNGTRSADPDGSIVSYAWTAINAPGAYSIANATLATTGVSGLEEGIYSFRLVVTDNSGGTDADTVLVKVNPATAPPPPPNVAPIARAGNDISITLPVNTTVLTATASTDSDGSIVSYLWSKISGPSQYQLSSATGATTNVNNLTEGTYLFRLQVKDNDGAIDLDTVAIKVNPAINTAPVANAGDDQQVSMPNPFIQLNGLGSSDAEGDIATYSWLKISGPGGLTILNSTTATPTVQGVQEGVYTFQLTVTDEQGATATDNVQVTVIGAANQAPVANAGNDQTLTVPANSTSLTGSGYDADGTIASYEWKQLNGPSSANISDATAAVTNVGSLQTGDYLFALTVTDNDGAIHRDTVAVSVINTMRSDDNVGVYPNPATTFINLKFESDSIGQVTINLYDARGMRMKTLKNEKNQRLFQQSVDISGLQTGIYFAECIVSNKQRIITRFVKQR
jgi:predicted esterase